jgi:hypothetical protein
MPLDHLNYDAVAGLTGAYIKGDLKLLVGAPPRPDNPWAGSEVSQASWFGGAPLFFSPNASMPAPPLNQTACWNTVPPYGCLFNLTADPTEHVDIAADSPALLAEMMADFVALNASFHPPYEVPASELASLCAVALENDNVAAPWRDAPLPGDVNSVQAVLADREFVGSQVIYFLRAPDGSELRMIVQEPFGAAEASLETRLDLHWSSADLVPLPGASA